MPVLTISATSHRVFYSYYINKSCWGNSSDHLQHCLNSRLTAVTSTSHVILLNIWRALSCFHTARQDKTSRATT